MDIILYLLQLEDSADKPGVTLVRLIFGKITANQFQLLGINNALKIEKIELTKFLLNLIKRVFDLEKDKNKPHHKPKFKKEYFKLENEKNDIDNNILKKKLILLNQKKNEREAELKSENAAQNNILKVFFKCNVPYKYIDHWFWLQKSKEISLNSFIDFTNLILKAFCSQGHVWIISKLKFLKQSMNS